MTSRRVAITGAGAISALGHSAHATTDAMLLGTNGISQLDVEDVERLSIQIGGQIRGFDPLAHFSKSELSLLDPFSQYARISAAQAVAQAGLEFDAELADRSGVILGTAGGGLQTQDQNFKAVYQDGKNRVHPFVVPRLMANAATSQISMAYGLRGMCYTVSTACASSNHAMGQAFHLIRSGAATAMLTGGSEAMLSFGGIKAWEGLRVMSDTGCRPFCATRNGMVQGEGAGVFVFEDMDHALARGATVLAEVVGFSMTSDAGDIVAPSVEGASRAILGGLRDGGVQPSDVGYINAHGTGTTLNDKTEVAAIREAFGDVADGVAISSTKSMHGHLIGATGAVELLSVIAAVQGRGIAPTINHVEDDPACDLDIVTNTARNADVEVAVSNAFAFGGLNAVLVLQRAP